MDIFRKQLAFTVKQIGPESDRTLRFMGSDETVDRDNDIIEVAGWITDSYLKNPVVLWSHNGYSTPPIAKTVNLIKDLTGKRLIFDIKFPTLEELSSDVANASDHAKFVDTIYNMCKNGYLNAVSVGFRGIKYKTRDDPDVLELPEWQRGRRYIEQELYEISICSIPANPNALQDAKAKGLLDDRTMKSFFDVQKSTNTKRTESEVKAMSEEKSGARLSDDSKKTLKAIQSDLSTGIKAHKTAHKTAIDAYKTIAQKMADGGKWDDVKDELEDAISEHEDAHKAALKCYKSCAKGLQDFLGGEDSDDDSGTQQQDGDTSDGVERALTSLATEVKTLVTELQKGKTPPPPKQDDVDLDSISSKDFAEMVTKSVSEKMNALTGKI